MAHVQRFICLWAAGFCALSRSKFCSQCSRELQKTSCMHRSVKLLLVRDHSILTLTRSLVVVQDFIADRVQFHSSHGHSSVFHHMSLPMAWKGVGTSLPPHSERCSGREESRFHRNHCLFSTTKDSRVISAR